MQSCKKLRRSRFIIDDEEERKDVQIRKSRKKRTILTEYSHQQLSKHLSNETRASERFPSAGKEKVQKLRCLERKCGALASSLKIKRSGKTFERYNRGKQTKILQSTAALKISVRE